ncbi:hypothetical protein B0H13DRAFT_2278789 [Mycena leptocephala]|nr:hypothetical protein B0H13DRAFT_2278789 [Mycena leptocephala]
MSVEFAGIVVDCRLSLSTCPHVLLRLVSSWMDRPPGPERHAPYEDIFGRRPAPAPARPRNRPATAPKRLPKSTGLPLHLTQYQRLRRRTTPHPHAHAYLPHPQQQQQTGAVKHMGPEPPPAVPTQRPGAGARPAHGRAGPDARAGVSSADCNVRAGAASGPSAMSLATGVGEEPGLNFEFESSTAGVTGNGNPNEDGEDDEESELPWARSEARSAGALAGCVCSECARERWVLAQGARLSARRSEALDGDEPGRAMRDFTSFMPDLSDRAGWSAVPDRERDAQRLISLDVSYGMEYFFAASYFRGRRMWGASMLCKARVCAHDELPRSPNAERACFVLLGFIHPAASHRDGGSQTVPLPPHSHSFILRRPLYETGAGQAAESTGASCTPCVHSPLTLLAALAVGSQRFIWVFLLRISFLLFLFLFVGGYSVSGEGARLWLWLACSRCWPAKDCVSAFLPFGLEFRDGTEGEGGTHLPSPGLGPQILPICVFDSGHADGDVPHDSVPDTWMYRRKRGAAVRMGVDGRQVSVRVSGARNISYAQGRDWCAGVNAAGVLSMVILS